MYQNDYGGLGPGFDGGTIASSYDYHDNNPNDDSDEEKEIGSDNDDNYTLIDFLTENKLLSLETAFKQRGITIYQLRRIHIDDLDDLIHDLNLSQYQQQEVLLRTGINQLQNSNNDSNTFISRSATARSISHIIKEKKSSRKKSTMNNTKDFDHLIKLVMVGDAAVGKSNLVVRFCDDHFEESYISTIGVDFKFRTLTFNDKLIKLQVWDTAGQERFRAITSAYYRSADGLLLCYDITNRATFESLTNWMSAIRKHTENFVMLVGCKLDAAQDNEKRRKVTEHDAQVFAELHDLQYIEVSAKTGENADNLFFTATDLIMKAIMSNKQAHVRGTTATNVTVDKKQFKKKKKRCGCK